mmetsp:Transcript_20543/g.44746  ORF Transcript_20543/g.44746 Transcript_20543/m.44746 type:complete len:225 (+) Transcript_20543:591-1265(+)
MYTFGTHSSPNRSFVTKASVSFSEMATLSFLSTNISMSIPPGASDAVSRKLLETTSGGNFVSPKPMVSSTMRDLSALYAFRIESVPVTDDRESPLLKALCPTNKLARWLFPAPVFPNTMRVQWFRCGSVNPLDVLEQDPPCVVVPGDASAVSSESGGDICRVMEFFLLPPDGFENWEDLVPNCSLMLRYWVITNALHCKGSHTSGLARRSRLSKESADSACSES